ncbi:hypothetical protein [Metallosphaera javensis (ex Sakai et al. 2022)]|uniref:hypothetical protein n=1 Tax=Metallosphaera javensis (ex Sakai et al. 2022) TaxID=2775498 RepID=UPI00258D83DA
MNANWTPEVEGDFQYVIADGKWVKLRGGKGVLLVTGVTREGRRCWTSSWLRRRTPGVTGGFLQGCGGSSTSSSWLRTWSGPLVLCVSSYPMLFEWSSCQRIKINENY